MAKGLTANELRTKLDDELVTKLKEAKEELFNLRFQAATGQLEHHGRLRAIRREIARIYTVMRERELGIITFVEEVPEEQAAEEPAESSPAAADRTADDAAAGEADDDSAAAKVEERT